VNDGKRWKYIINRRLKLGTLNKDIDSLPQGQTQFDFVPMCLGKAFDGTWTHHTSPLCAVALNVFQENSFDHKDQVIFSPSLCVWEAHGPAVVIRQREKVHTDSVSLSGNQQLYFNRKRTTLHVKWRISHGVRYQI